MLTKSTGCRTSANKLREIHGGAIFGPQRYNLSKLGRGSQDDATNIISRPSVFYVFGPRGITWMNSSDNGEWTLCILEIPENLLHFIRICTVCYDKCNIQRLKYTFIRKVYLWPLKHIMDNPIIIVAICMGESIFLESREKTLQTIQPHLQDLSPLQHSYNIFKLDLVLQ